MAAQQYLVLIRGKGTTNAQRIPTTMPLDWADTLQRWVTMPTDREEQRP
jgi:hypothetical protein